MRLFVVSLVACLLAASTVAADGLDNAPLPDRIRSKPIAAPKTKTKTAKKYRRPAFTGANAPKSSYRKDPLPRPSGDLWIKAANQGVELRVQLYKRDGRFDNAALAKLDDMFRCLVTGEVRAMRPEVYEQLSRIQDHFGGKQLEMYSAFRMTDRSSSRHFHASAADFKIPGVSIYEIKKYAETLDTGNMGLGIYPSGQFIHVDVRAPGEPSFRWTDYSGPSRFKPKRNSKPRTQPARKPVS